MLLLALARHTGIRLAELGFLLAAIAGGLLLIVAIVPVGRRVGAAFAGLALAAGGVLLIVATHWGHFG
jgi:membrane-bound ClpP family serine protease